MSASSSNLSSDRKGKSRALPVDFETPSSTSPELREAHDLASHYPPARESERWTTATMWRESRRRAKADRRGWDHVLSSGVAGGVAGCVAKTAIAPLDRIKILFQTSNAEFRQFAGNPRGLVSAMSHIYRTAGVRGLFQGHSATLLRIFPYAGIKFMAYDWLESILIPTPDHRTPQRYFLAGAASGVTSVFFTYPLELLRVRLAYQTQEGERTTLRQAVRLIYREAAVATPSATSTSTVASTSATAGAAAAATAPPSAVSPFIRSLPFYPFYRGFSITILGMIPYAGVSFLTYGTLKRYLPIYLPNFAERKTTADLACGAIAGAVSQTASYPFEVVRRRMQVGGARGGGGVNWRQAVRGVYTERGGRGFWVGLSIGYLKVVPMTSISFATWQLMKRALEI